MQRGGGTTPPLPLRGDTVTIQLLENDLRSEPRPTFRSQGRALDLFLFGPYPQHCFTEIFHRGPFIDRASPVLLLQLFQKSLDSDRSSVPIGQSSPILFGSL